MGVFDSATQNARDVRAKAVQAFTVNAAYLAIGTPTAAQAITQVGVLTREMNGLLRLLFDQLDNISDT